MVNIGDVVLDILAEVSANLAIALEEVFASHVFLTRNTAGGDDGAIQRWACRGIPLTGIP